jgi:TRAP-type uncharacterized transport system substrate-binding protein
MQRRLFLAAVPTLGLSFAADHGWAETPPKPMVVSSGGTTGTYYRLMKELDEAAPGLIVNTESDGSLTNVDRVMDNQAELGITELDALYIRAMKETNLKERIRILALLHSEEIHFIAKVPPPSDGGILGFNFKSKNPRIESVDDLRGRKIGIWGAPSSPSRSSPR